MTALDHVENVCLCRESTNSDHEEKKSCSQPLLPPPLLPQYQMVRLLAINAQLIAHDIL